MSCSPPVVWSCRSTRRPSIASLLLLLLVTPVSGWWQPLPPAAQPALMPPPPAASIRPSPLAPEAPPLSPLDAAALSVFRWQLQQVTGREDPRPGFEGMLAELRDFMRSEFSEPSCARRQIDASEAIMAALGGPLPAIFRAVASNRAWAPGALAACTTALLRFLVGDMILTQRAPGDARAGGVLIQRCKVLEQGGCKSLCVNMCKRPTERFFAQRWGLPLMMSPNFETLQCQLSFGVAPLPEEQLGNLLPPGCLAGCPLGAAGGGGAGGRERDVGQAVGACE